MNIMCRKNDSGVWLIDSSNLMPILLAKVVPRQNTSHQVINKSPSHCSRLQKNLEEDWGEIKLNEPREQKSKGKMT